MQIRKARQKKYFAPQNENKKHRCDHPGCEKEGEYRAPKDRGVKEYYWFCLEHVQEYNAKWNYYGGAAESEESEEQSKTEEAFKKFRFSAKVKYSFGFSDERGYDFTQNYQPKFNPVLDIRFTAQERAALRVLEIDIEDLELKILKKQYKIMAKKYHPDVNKNNPEHEEKFKLISAAYKSISNKLS